MKKDIRKLIRMALITSPLLAVFSIVPISIFVSLGIISPRPIQGPNGGEHGILMPIIIITLNMLVIWFINIWLVKRINQRNASDYQMKRYIISFSIILLLAIVIFFISHNINPFPRELRHYPFIRTTANNAFILIMIDLILTRGRKADLEIEKANLEAINLKTRLDQLKQQIQPHFLFNALNTLKLLFKRDQDAAESYIVRLSNLLRSSISDGQEETITVNQDLEIFKDFMELQKVRFPEALEYTSTLSLNTLRNFHLPVFTFQLLAENAIKHNGFEKQTPLKIEIYEKDGYIYFSNNTEIKKQKLPSTGIGLNNLSERFKIISGYDIEVEKTQVKFIVKFKTISI